MTQKLSILSINKGHFVSELRALGHNILIAGVSEEHKPGRADSWSLGKVDIWYKTDDSIDTLFKLLPKDFSPDVLIYHDDSRTTFRLEGIERSPVPTVFYSVDSHIHHPWHPEMSGVFDYVLVAQKDYVPRFAKFCSEAKWFPLWAPKFIEPLEVKTIDVCFRGSLDPVQRKERVKFLEELKKIVSVDAAALPYEDAFTKSKIVINEAISGDVNFRVFEALMSGAMLLTPLVKNGLLDLFADKKHLVTYEPFSARDAAEKIHYYLEHQKEREEIARSGRAEVLANHTAQSRAEHLVDLFHSISILPRQRKNYANTYRVLFELHHTPGMEKKEIERKLFDALEFLKQGALTNEPFEPDMVLLLYTAIKGLKAQGKLEVSLPTLEALYSAYPAENAFQILAIAVLREINRIDDADNLITNFGFNKDSILAALPGIIDAFEKAPFFEPNFP